MFKIFAKKHRPNPQKPGGPAPQKSFYLLTPERLPGAGVQRYAFHSMFLNPPQSIYGHSVLAQGLRSLQGPPAVATGATLTQGLGGIVAGQIMLQPLLDDSDTSGFGGTS